jgi:tetratricopeptide (TPR) repeat protein
MTTRTFGGALRFGLAALVAAATGIWCGSAAAQTPAAPAGQTPAPAPAGQAAAPSVGAAQVDPFTVENLIGDAVSLSNQKYPEVESAIQRFKNGDGIGAKEYLDQAKQKYPKLPPVELLLAKLQVFARNGDGARALLETTVTNYPNDPEAYLLLADLAFAEGRTTEAHALFEKAKGLVEKFTDNAKRQQNFQIRVLAGLGAVHERRQQWAEANALLAKWVQVDPESAAAHTRLGVTLFRLKKPAEALAEFQKARELQPTSNHPQVMLGSLYTQERNIAEARKAFEKAYTEDGKNEATARAYAEWLIQQDQLDKAQQVAAAMRKNQPDSIAALMLDGVVAKMRNQPAAAEEALTKVLSLDVTNAGATNLLALVLAESTNPTQQEKALSYARMNAERFPTNSQANVTYAWILTKLGRGNEANQYLQKAVEARNLNADSAYLVARIFMQNNQKDQAKLALEQVLTQAAGGMFMYRKEAEALLKELGGTVPQPGATPVSTQTTPAARAPAATTPPRAGTPGSTPVPPPVAGQ